jgi:hypothetical protein
MVISMSKQVGDYFWTRIKENYHIPFATPVESHLLLFMNDHKRLGLDFMLLFNIVLT